MNCDISKSNTLPSCLVKESKLYKKSKRKRRRNKLFFSKFKKTNKKKFQTQNMSYQNINSKSKRSRNKEEMEWSENGKVMSNWYWSNYKKAVEWQDKHKIAHWKSCALALQEENRYLLQIIHSMQSGMYLNVPTTMKNLEKKGNSSSKKMTKSKCSERRSKKETVREVDNYNEDLNDEEIEFEMSEEMIKFFEQSYKHKMDLGRCRPKTEKAKQEKEELNAENEVKQIQENKLKRCEEMKLLYGDSASMIIGMETAVQLSFDRYCDTKSPKYWPNIPLRL